MRRVLLVGGFLLLASPARAVEIDVGGTRLSIPAPAGCAPVTDDMIPYARLAAKFVPPENVQYALFLPEGDTALAAKGGIPVPERYFYVQVAKQVVYHEASLEDFGELKREIRAHNATWVKRVEEQMPGFFRELSQGISREHDIEMALSLNSALPLEPHHESDRSLAYSLVASYEIANEQGDPVPFQAAVTATFVLLKGKIVFLYATAGSSELAWTREAARRWTEEVEASNPSGAAGIGGGQGVTRRGFDWGEVAVFAAVGAVIGAVVGAIGHFVAKKRRPASSLD